MDLYTVLTAGTDLILKDSQMYVCIVLSGILIMIIVRNSIAGILIILKKTILVPKGVIQVHFD